MNKDELLDKIFQYANNKVWTAKEFEPGIDDVPVSGALITADDIVAVVSCVLDGWFTEGKISDNFRKELAHWTGTRHVSLCNSGSSANLLAVTALNHIQKGNRNEARLVITCATGFPTTVTPIYLNGLVPLFVDSGGYRTLNADVDTVLEQLERKDVCGVILAHTLGFPYRADLIRKKCDELDKWFVEDVCDALSAKVMNVPNDDEIHYGDFYAGQFGHASTLSFFPAHHITTGEGGSVQTNDGRLHALINSYRDWGRSCYCAPGEQDTCNKRFDWKVESLPDKWDHKYMFDNIGYNLRMTEMQTALGNSQLEKMSLFRMRRHNNYYDLHWMLSTNEHTSVGQDVTNGMSPFGFPITVISDAFTKQELVTFLENRKIRTRPVFGGNLTRQPAFRKMYYEQVGNLANSDYIMDRTFWIGCAPLLKPEQLDYVAKSFRDFFRERGLS